MICFVEITKHKKQCAIGFYIIENRLKKANRKEVIPNTLKIIFFSRIKIIPEIINIKTLIITDGEGYPLNSGCRNLGKCSIYNFLKV